MWFGMKTITGFKVEGNQAKGNQAEGSLNSCPEVGVEDAIIYLLQQAISHLDKAGSTVRIMFFDFSSAFNTIQPTLLPEKLQKMQVDASTTSWIIDYLADRAQSV